jgi:hypothetical protein
MLACSTVETAMGEISIGTRQPDSETGRLEQHTFFGSSLDGLALSEVTNTPQFTTRLALMISRAAVAEEGLKDLVICYSRIIEIETKVCKCHLNIFYRVLAICVFFPNKSVNHFKIDTTACKADTLEVG